MLRHVCVIALLAVSLRAAILPESFGSYRRISVSAVATDSPAIWTEYGLEASEKATYSGNLTITAWRLADPTGAYAAWLWQRATGNVARYENYVLLFDGAKLGEAARTELQSKLKNVVRSSLPPLEPYFPAKARIASSERYLLGPSSLAAFEPRIPANAAAFDRGAEAQLARYRLRGEEATLAIFAYPTPQIARDRLRAFQQIPGLTARRAGPLVVALAGPADPAQASVFLAQIKYAPGITWTEETPKDPGNPGDMMLAIFSLAGILIGASIVLGLIFGGIRVVGGRLAMRGPDQDFTSLNIGN